MIESPIFILGCSNSGTTILWDALATHPELCRPPIEDQDLKGMPLEMTHHLGDMTFRMWGHYLFDAARERHTEDEGLPGARNPYYVTEKDWTPELQERVEEIYSQFLEGDKRLCGKSPAHTLRARLLYRCFPDAKFVGIVRNPYAVSEGVRRKRADDPERPKYRGLQTRICDAAEHWLGANKVLFSYRQLLPIQIITYEHLVQDTGGTLRQVFQHCNLQDVLIPLNFRTTDNEQSISRLTLAEIGVIREITRPSAQEWGYAI